MSSSELSLIRIGPPHQGYHSWSSWGLVIRVIIVVTIQVGHHQCWSSSDIQTQPSSSSGLVIKRLAHHGGWSLGLVITSWSSRLVITSAGHHQTYRHSHRHHQDWSSRGLVIIVIAGYCAQRSLADHAPAIWNQLPVSVRLVILHLSVP